MKPARQHQRWSDAEIHTLRRWAGIKTASDIGAILGRSHRSVRHKIRELGLSGRMYGEQHWSAKYPDLLVAMVLTLYDAGFTPLEITTVLTRGDVNYKAIEYIAYRRSK